jgi:FKBP-type peptidyl-prolyl cis-trans isomerase
VKRGMIICIFLFLASQSFAADTVTLRTEKDKVNYGIGVVTVRNFKQQGIEIDLDMVIQGMRDALANGSLLLNEEDLRATMMAVQTDIRQKQRQARRLSALENRSEGEAFLSANSKKDGVVVLPSGLQYKIIKQGEGKKPTDADEVLCHYRSTLINGTEIDNSYAAGKPLLFRVKDGVIPGWNEALKRMPVGSKWQLFVPPQLAYGDRGSGMIIGSNETLIFEVELLAIK